MQAFYNSVSDFVKLISDSFAAYDMMILLSAVAIVAFWKHQGQKRAAVPTRTKGWSKKLGESKKEFGYKRSFDSDASTEVPERSDSRESSDISSHTDGSNEGISRRQPPLRKLQNRSYRAPGTFVSNDRRAVAAHGMPTNFGSGFPSGAQQTHEMRDSIKTLKGVLEKWEAALPADEPVAAPADSAALMNAVAKLTPEEAEVVRSLLNDKLGQSPGNSQPGVYRNGASQRPFKTFEERKGPFKTFAEPKGSTRPCLNDLTPEQQEESLATHLRDLAQIENGRVLMLRKINRLGLDSAAILKAYFSKFGAVERVMVAPTKTKSAQNGSVPGKVRVRAAPLGFIVMSKVEGASAAIGSGIEHSVEGATINVFPFTSHSIVETL